GLLTCALPISPPTCGRSALASLWASFAGARRPRSRLAADLHLSLGHSLKTRGRRTPAIEAYKLAIAARPKFGDAYWSLANLKTYTFSDAEIAQLEASEADPSTDDLDRYHLCFALGKAHEDRAEHARSFRYYERGNALKRAPR